MKVKNPLYVVKDKGTLIEEANGLFDYAVKKFHLGPLIELLKSLIEMIIDEVNSYAGLIILKSFLDKIISKFELFKKFGIV